MDLVPSESLPARFNVAKLFIVMFLVDENVEPFSIMNLPYWLIAKSLESVAETFALFAMRNVVETPLITLPVERPVAVMSAFVRISRAASISPPFAPIWKVPRLSFAVALESPEFWTTIEPP